ncbi:DUF1344 domain-containing protein [Nitratireductor rhodophyticola]|uniref:DUF1344 domain-containing protein n=1 Tax=Nitratireductor rhodophyticola TaxID=2854036 RepID=UPI00081410C6|nr:DUF1344 domain-containing protein [Nitratireductor rhodophyticola]WPZ12897.1 DUF1344 domain-containing protein [Nitratireductor rhodophyticola]
MKKILAALAATGFLTLSAYAADVQGTVQSVDPATRTIALEDGTVYTAGEGVDLASISAGASVTLTIDDTTNEVTSVEAQM